MTVPAAQVIAAAASHIGYYARPGTPSKFGVWYGLPKDPWCAMFVSHCAAQAGAQSIIPKHAYTPSGAAWFKAQGRWRNGVAGVQRGDIVFFDFPGAPARISHVGIVESVNADGSVNTIEGNTSGTVNGDQRNGGLVARKRRKSYIVGYGRPAYTTNGAAGATTEEDDMFDDKDRALLKRVGDLVSWTHSGMYYGSETGGSKYPGLIPAVLGDGETSLVNRIWNRLIHRTAKSTAVIQEIADIRTAQAKQVERDAERDALLAKIAEKVGVEVTS